MSVNLNATGTIIHVNKNGKEIFTYDYLDLYNLWHQELGYESEEDDDEESEPCVDYEAHIIGNELFIGLLECADQVGILGIVDITTGNLIHVQNAEYYLYGISNNTHVITVHCVHFYGCPPYYTIDLMKKGSSHFDDSNVSIKIPRGSGYFGYIGDVDLKLEGTKVLLSGIEDSHYEVDLAEYLELDKPEDKVYS